MPPLDAIRARFRAPAGPLRDAIRLALNAARHFSSAVSARTCLCGGPGS